MKSDSFPFTYHTLFIHPNLDWCLFLKLPSGHLSGVGAKPAWGAGTPVVAEQTGMSGPPLITFLSGYHPKYFVSCGRVSYGDLHDFTEEFCGWRVSKEFPDLLFGLIGDIFPGIVYAGGPDEVRTHGLFLSSNLRQSVCRS